MAAIQHMEITGYTIPLFGSEYRIKESKFNIAFTESDISTPAFILVQHLYGFFHRRWLGAIRDIAIAMPSTVKNIVL